MDYVKALEKHVEEYVENIAEIQRLREQVKQMQDQVKKLRHAVANPCYRSIAGNTCGNCGHCKFIEEVLAEGDDGDE